MRPAAADDLDALWAIWAEPEVRRYLFDDVAVTRERASGVLADAAAAAEHGLGLWTARTTEIVGCVGLLPVTTMAEYDPAMAGGIEPVVAFAPSVWSRGYATEALRAVIRHALDELGLPRLVAATDVPNVASDRVLTRVGFVAQRECDGPKYRIRTYVLRRATPRDGRAAAGLLVTPD